MDAFEEAIKKYVQEISDQWKHERYELKPGDKEFFKVPNDITIEQAMNRFCLELEKDKSEGSYYYAWQANIAMAFKDSVRQQLDPKNKGHNLYDDSFGDMALHEAANNAAKNFLNSLCSQKSH